MTTQEIKQVIKNELPKLLEKNPKMRQWVLELTETHYVRREENAQRFEQLLEELRQDRKAQQAQWDEENKKWDEENKKWDEENKKWDENQKMLNRILDRLERMETKHDSHIGALGARWGLSSEASFRNGLKGILDRRRVLIK